MGVRAEATVSLGEVRLPADVDGPDDATGVVLFAHGSGSSRHSPRNVAVARVLQRRRLVTVLVDLLTAEEDADDARTAQWRFDIDLLADRLTGTLDWLAAQPTLGRLPVGLFGASTGAAAALVAAAARPQRVAAVVSRGGRPDLAGPALSGVRAPTLLLVGGLDDQVITVNEQAAEVLAAPHELRVVSGAGHLFEEPGTLDQVADAAADWFTRHLPVPA
ncbi:dienelactone hydrolase family protein [Micromonospora sp. HUAS LYJ1]|uniref:dienelactone hydrolase family protein n=1 Tax=Micromonospora sp. HUAS LYJ1 TaxID=3061626 RepID=UPI002671F1F8|nr:dienelactone hydrolase family protein [Micromonospora sp. HUAS LYJ1]WKU03887.1 dienelactone hydrolase family protein [Micromonospora sp. HUAS LYJ1]